MQVARIKLSGRNPAELDTISNEIREIAKKFGIDYHGPIPLPTKKMKITTLKTPSGDGTGHGKGPDRRADNNQIILRRIIFSFFDGRAFFKNNTESKG